MQSPVPGTLNLDHLAYFVPERDRCREALQALGFAPSPFSLQRHRSHPQAQLVPVGSGNHCAMLRHGYLEFLVPTARTPVAEQLRGAIARYVGIHSIVFGTADPLQEHARLSREGFAPLAPIALERPIETCRGEETARFTVVRVAPDTMQEGRIQFCQHHSEALVWQPRWLTHPNRAVGLLGVYVGVQDPEEAIARYQRFTGLSVERLTPGCGRLSTDRGWILLCDAPTLENALQIRVRQTPVIAGCELLSADVDATRQLLCGKGFNVRDLDDGRIAVSAPSALGSEFVFAAKPLNAT